MIILINPGVKKITSNNFYWLQHLSYVNNEQISMECL